MLRAAMQMKLHASRITRNVMLITSMPSAM